jgi:anti-sigma B factor antagonist
LVWAAGTPPKQGGQLNISVRKAGDVTIVDLTGALKLGGPELAFREAIEGLLESGVLTIAVNLSGVNFLDSSGIGSLVRCHKTATERSGKLIFFAPTKMVKQTLKMVSLDKVMNLFEDEASALAAA